ncbi:hypothetical protein JCGZ_05688 [Jatropha curcas]|uniref:Uncharacterized protein n=1 Tax=Jatropha curcas TaxID=180498 RepID=A0A067L718_JATCU|nr:uncharacterized protein LOC105628243 [Jatropha curcas]KDP44221.1 hypothetical protein JCGZ_05688 [Jatropha curcas]
MGSFSGLGIGLSLVFGCLLLALVAELYYLLFWKKRVANREIEENEDYSSNYAKEFFHLICWKKHTSHLQGNSTNTQIRDPMDHCLQEQQDLELGTSKDLLIKAFGEESVESELMRLHNLSGPPRFLFTIKEETKEDLESDDGKSRGDRSRKASRTRSLSDLILSVDTPFLTPLASPKLKSPPLNALDYYNHHGFNPLFESSSMDAETHRLRSSPPPKFKFLRDAEDKLYKRLMEERALKNTNVSVQDSRNQDSRILLAEEAEGSFLGFIVSRNKERDVFKHHHLPQYPSSSSQVLPLASSPTAFSPLDKKP